ACAAGPARGARPRARRARPALQGLERAPGRAWKSRAEHRARLVPFRRVQGLTPAVAARATRTLRPGGVAVPKLVLNRMSGVRPRTCSKETTGERAGIRTRPPYNPTHDDLLRDPARARRRALRQDGRLLQGQPERRGDHRPAGRARP